MAENKEDQQDDKKETNPDEASVAEKDQQEDNEEAPEFISLMQIVKEKSKEEQIIKELSRNSKFDIEI